MITSTAIPSGVSLETILLEKRMTQKDKTQKQEHTRIQKHVQCCKGDS